MARLKVFRKSATGRVFVPLTSVQGGGTPKFDNPTPEQIEAFGLAPKEDPAPVIEAPKRRKR